VGVIHTVGPVWNNGIGDEERLLASAYVNSLKLAVENQIKTIAFPNISTGVYLFPKDKAAEIAITSVTEFLKTTNQIEKVIFVCFDEENYGVYRERSPRDSFFQNNHSP
jgi:O-acetyl-ADP-ribose deacetylase (regulator of RNase III)